MPLKITLDDRALRRYIDRSAKSWPDAASKALEKVGRLAFAQSQAEVPVGSTHRLKQEASIYVAPHTITITYSAPYARIVHFRKHVKHPDGKRLFLLRPQNKAKRLLPSVISQFIQDAMDSTPSG